MAKTVEHYHETVNTGGSGDSGMGFVFGIILLIVLLAVFWYWGLPFLKNIQQGGINIQMPDTVNVNVQQQPAQ